jgi:hypothetical protein
MKTRVEWMLAIGLSLFVLESYGQSSGFVIAGQPSGGNNYSLDFNPDSTRSTHVVLYSYYPSEFDSLPIDLNGDNGTECRFIWTCWEDHGFYAAELYLKVASGTQVACSTGSTLEFPFQMGDTIGPGLHWVGGSAFPALLHRTYPYFPTPDTIENANWPLQSVRYAGLRFLEASDTCYAWLEFTVGGTFPQIELTVNALATNCSQGAVTANSNAMEAQVAVFPNPAMDRIAVAFQSQQGGNYNIRVIGSFGQEIFSQSVRMNDGSQLVEIDVSNWAPGAYHLVAEGNGQHLLRRISILR